MSKNYAVFTGDLVGASRASTESLERSMSAIEGGAHDVETMTGQSLRFTRHRGDGWQLCLTDVSKLWLTLVLILASLKAEGGLLDTRASIGVGPVDSLGTKDLNDASGFAFTISGRGLDSLQKAHRRPRNRLASDPVGLGLNGKLGIVGIIDDHDLPILEFISHLSLSWSVPQAEAIRLALLNPNMTQEQVAQGLGISRQALAARLKNAGFIPIQLAVLTNKWENEPKASP